MGMSLTVGWREMEMAEWALQAAVFATPAPVQPAAVGTASSGFFCPALLSHLSHLRASQPCLSLGWEDSISPMLQGSLELGLNSAI